MKLLAIALFSFLQQTDPINELYEKLEKKEGFQKINITSDKDYYFKGENVFFFGSINDSDEPSNTNAWAYSILFDNDKNVINYSRHKLDNGYLAGSIKIPDSTTSKNLNIGTLIPGEDYFYSKPISIIDGSRNSKKNTKSELYFRLKSRNLIAGQKNEIYIINPSGERTKIIIAEKNYWVENKLLVELVPEKGRKYSINLGDKSITLPEVKESPSFTTNQVDKNFTFSFTPETKNSEGYFIAFAGQEVIWLTKLSDIKNKINIDLSSIESNSISGYIINDKNEQLFREITLLNKKEEIVYELENDSIYINTSSRNINQYSVAKAVDKTFLYDRSINFNENEIFELSLNESLPDHNMFFGTEKEKELWINFQLESKIEKILSDESELNENKNQLSIPDISYIIDSDKIQKPKGLEINVIDITGNIIDYELVENKIHIDISSFENTESELLLTAKYKGRQLNLLRDPSNELEYIDSVLKEVNIIDPLIYHSSSIEFPLYSDFSGEAEFLAEVVVSANKEKPTFKGRGNIITFEELPLTDYTVTADAFLSRLGISKPNPLTGIINSTRRRFSVTGTSQGYSSFYPLFLSIVGQGTPIYSGVDFNKLKSYPAAWVYSMVKINSDPEGVVVVLNPGFRTPNSGVYNERIFGSDLLNKNAGVFTWNYFWGNSTNAEFLNPNSEFYLFVYTPLRAED